jgi:hypothetical protein
MRYKGCDWLDVYLGKIDKENINTEFEWRNLLNNGHVVDAGGGSY